jgi:protein involved in polysaccharide export with SLBB domain
MRGRFLFCMLLATALLLASGFAQGNPNGAVAQQAGRPDAPLPGFTERHHYTLRPGDVVELKFPFTPEFDQLVTVRPDGYISLREGQDLYVAGMDINSLRAAVRDQYSKVLRDPAIAAELKQFEKPYFIAGGDLNNPGKYELSEDLTLGKAVQIAGGLRRGAKPTEVYVFRYEGGTIRDVRKASVKKLYERASLAEDLPIQPGDMIYVPRTTLSKLQDFILPRVMVGPRVRVSF